MEFGAGEHKSQRRTSMSWQDFVRRDGAEKDELRQLPLVLISSDSFQRTKGLILAERSCEQSATIPLALCG